MKRKMLIQFCVGFLLWNTIPLRAAPLRLTVQPKGTNQVELTLEPVLPNLPYEVMARTNGANGPLDKVRKMRWQQQWNCFRPIRFRNCPGLDPWDAAELEVCCWAMGRCCRGRIAVALQGARHAR